MCEQDWADECIPTEYTVWEHLNSNSKLYYRNKISNRII